MKFFNTIATLTFAATMMVAQAQATELVKAEPVAKFTISKAAQENLAASMQLQTFSSTSAKVALNTSLAKIEKISTKKTQDLAKSILIAE
jgi:hypothetical protein